VTRLTGNRWEYLKVLQVEFTKLQAGAFSGLTMLG
jgi:hypothetical protein